MSWIKQNLFVVVAAVVVLGLLGGSGFYLYTQIQKERQIDAEWKAKLAERDQLVQKNPQKETIEAIKAERGQLESVVHELEQRFRPIPYPAVASSYQFKTNLDSTLAELRVEADAAKVTLREKEGFSFSTIREEVQFDPGSLQPLAMQLAEVKAICNVLFQAKVHSLDDFRRVPVSKQDQAGSADYLNKKITTNGSVVITPYQVTFRGFSEEIASVVNQFTESPHCFLLKSINVESSVPVTPTSAPPPAPIFVSTPMTPAIPLPGMDESLMKRYGLGAGGASDVMRQRYGGLGGRYGAPGEGQAVNPLPMMAPARGSITNLVDEKTLKVTVALEIVKKLEKPAPAAAKP